LTHTQDFRSAHHAALKSLQQKGRVYPCACTRSQLANLPVSETGERVYDGRCQHSQVLASDARALRLRVADVTISFTDRWCGQQSQALAQQVGDFVLWRPQSVVGFAGGLYNYQLTMVVDDAAAGVSHVVRGADLLGNTARQLHVYDVLALERPSYLHVPVVRLPDGAKLSKQHGAPALPLLPSTDPIPLLNQALVHLGCPPCNAVTLTQFWRAATRAWVVRLETTERA
jgi:glutamyl-Q tRNA(Asp) synthetase